MPTRIVDGGFKGAFVMQELNLVIILSEVYLWFKYTGIGELTVHSQRILLGTWTKLRFLP